MSTLGSRIREARINKGLTQKQLADLIGAKHNSVSDWEKDKNKPDADTIEYLMGALEVDANTLLGWDRPEQLKADAEELSDKILSNPKIKKMLPFLEKISDKDMDFVKEFIQKIAKDSE